MASTTPRQIFSGLSRNTFLLALASLFADISTEMLYPILPVFLTQTLHATGSVVGLVEGFAQAAQNVVQGFSGALSDKLQKRKPIALLGYFMAALGKPLIGVATVWPAVFGARFLDRLGSGLAPRRATRSSRLQSMTRTEAEPLASKASATMQGHSWGRSWPLFSSIPCIWICA